MSNEVLKICEKLISADVKANIKQQEIKVLVAVSYKFLCEEVPSKLEIQCKKGMYFYFHLILVGIRSILLLSVENKQGVGFFLVNGQNPLSVAKVVNSSLFNFQ